MRLGCSNTLDEFWFLIGSWMLNFGFASSLGLLFGCMQINCSFYDLGVRLSIAKLCLLIQLWCLCLFSVFVIFNRYSCQSMFVPRIYVISWRVFLEYGNSLLSFSSIRCMLIMCLPLLAQMRGRSTWIGNFCCLETAHVCISGNLFPDLMVINFKLYSTC